MMLVVEVKLNDVWVIFNPDNHHQDNYLPRGFWDTDRNYLGFNFLNPDIRPSARGRARTPYKSIPVKGFPRDVSDEVADLLRIDRDDPSHFGLDLEICPSWATLKEILDRGDIPRTIYHDHVTVLGRTTAYLREYADEKGLPYEAVRLIYYFSQ